MRFNRFDNERKVKFFSNAKRIWKENKFGEKLEDLLEEGKGKIDPIDVETNPFFVIDKEFSEKLLSEGVVEKGNDEDDRFITAFLSMKFLPYQLGGLTKILEGFLRGKKEKDSDEDCDGDCMNCPKGKELLAKLDDKEFGSPSPDNNNPGGIWN